MRTASPSLEAFQNREALSDQYGDNALLLFALEMRFAIDDIDTAAASSLTDGPLDRKCDAIFIDRDSNTAVIAQGFLAKTHKPAAPSNKAADLTIAVSWIFSRDYSRMNDSLQAAAQELDQAIHSGDISSIELWYCHNLPESTNVQDELNKATIVARNLVSKSYPEVELSVSALEVGSLRLDEWYASVQNPILVADALEVDVDGWFEEVGEDWTAVCVSVPATWLTELHDTYGDKLFSANVRGYMPSRKAAKNINHNIEETARAKAGRFWAYNNGVTALVHDYTAPRADRRGKLKLNGLAIVNGAQTTGALSRSRSTALADAAVLTRFIKSDNDEIIDEIIRYNNSQNPIKPADFRSTDRHQERLRRQFNAIPDSLYFGARRGGQQDRARRPSNLISSDTVAQSLAAFHGNPGLAYHQLRTIWENDQTYSDYFSEATTAPHIVFTYSLLTAIQHQKVDLVQRENQNQLAQDEREILAVFRQRGSQFLLLAAIGSCVEIVLGRPIGNRFSLSFGGEVSPKVGSQLWGPVVEAVLPFANCLRADELKGSLRNRTRVDDALSSFRAIIRSTAKGNQAIFREFASRVEGG